MIKKRIKITNSEGQHLMKTDIGLYQQLTDHAYD